jgi:transcription elongation factor GreA
MAENKTVMITREGLEKLEKELESLKTEKRREVSEKIKEARGFGDLSENAEYDEAKNEQAEVEARIVHIEKTLKNIQIIDVDEKQANIVNLGRRVRVFDQSFDEEAEYIIVGSTEANPSENKISNESPVGAALLGKKVGDVAEVSIPNGTVITIKVLEISK